MRRSLKVRLALVAVTVGAVAVAALPANASTGSLVLIGTGSISPGLTQAGGTSQSFWFGASGVLVSTDGVILNITCTVTGNDIIGSWSQGLGSFSGSCYVPGGPTPVTGSYTRTGASVTMNVWFSGGLLNGPFIGGCGWAPTDIETNSQRVDAFAMTCLLNQT